MPLSRAAMSRTGSTDPVPVLMQRYAEPRIGFSGYQWPLNFSLRARSSSSPKRLTRLLGSLLYRYDITKLRATWISTCMAAEGGDSYQKMSFLRVFAFRFGILVSWRVRVFYISMTHMHFLRQRFLKQTRASDINAWPAAYMHHCAVISIFT